MTPRWRCAGSIILSREPRWSARVLAWSSKPVSAQGRKRSAACRCTPFRHHGGQKISGRGDAGPATPDVEHLPAYQAMKEAGADACGLTQLASRTVGVPFVGLTAGVMVIAELLRRLHGGTAFELLAGSVAGAGRHGGVAVPAPPYAFGHLAVA